MKTDCVLSAVDEQIATLQAKKKELEAAASVAEGEVRIVVAQRGWVLVGYYSETADDVKLTKSSVIRTWGTTKGLGQLTDGPTKSTVLDPCGTTMIPRLGVVLSKVCNSAGWKSSLVV